MSFSAIECAPKNATGWYRTAGFYYRSRLHKVSASRRLSGEYGHPGERTGAYSRPIGPVNKWLVLCQITRLGGAELLSLFGRSDSRSRSRVPVSGFLGPIHGKSVSYLSVRMWCFAATRDDPPNYSGQFDSRWVKGFNRSLVALFSPAPSGLLLSTIPPKPNAAWLSQQAIKIHSLAPGYILTTILFPANEGQQT